jgi:hypothetical protein
LEVLDPQERPIRDLTPKTGDEPFLRGDPTALNYAAQLPADFECVNCTIRYAQSSILSIYFQSVRYINHFSLFRAPLDCFYVLLSTLLDLWTPDTRTVSEDSGIEPRTVAMYALFFIAANYWATSHPVYRLHSHSNYTILDFG